MHTATITTETTTVSTSTPTIALDPAVAAILIDKYAQAKAAIKALEAEKDAAEAALRALMGDAREGTVDGVVRVTIAHRNRSNIDRKKLQEIAPEVHDICLTETSYTVLQAR